MADQQTPGSFIPHDTAVAAPRVRSHSSLNDLLLLVSVVLVVASGALAIGVFLYGQLLQQQSTSKQAQLQRAEAAFEPSLVEQITRLDDRMHAAQQILGLHIAPITFFQALNQATLQTVSFQSLDFEMQDPQHLTLKMQGIAQSVNSIALQAEIFSKSNVITNPIFSNIAKQPDGVHFDFTGNVNPVALNYGSYVTGNTGATVPQVGNAPTSTPQTQGNTDTGAPSPFGTPQVAPAASSPTP